ncbi:MAG: hypothetical protein ACO3SO_00265 [Luteolibacter sp.]
MTYTRYILQRIGKAFGINPKGQRNSDIISEKHLLRQGEVELGKLTWREVGKIDALAESYQHLCRLAEHHEQLSKNLKEGREQLKSLSKAEDKTSPELNKTNKEVASLLSERSALEKEMTEHHRLVGKYIMRHADQLAACRKAASCQRHLLDVLRALGRSIDLNRRLNGTRAR